MDKRFEELLLLYAQENEADERKKIDAALWQEFGKVRAVLVMDMSGFSLLSYRHGIVHYLSMVRRMQLASEPIIDQYGGLVVKFEADNCFALFDEPLAAVRAALALNTAFFGMNVLTARRVRHPRPPSVSTTATSCSSAAPTISAIRSTAPANWAKTSGPPGKSWSPRRRSNRSRPRPASRGRNWQWTLPASRLRCTR